MALTPWFIEQFFGDGAEPTNPVTTGVCRDWCMLAVSGARARKLFLLYLIQQKHSHDR
jgi:hypothetical protein